MYKAIVKIPSLILKELVSDGDRKTSKLEILYQSYLTAIKGLFDMQRYLNNNAELAAIMDELITGSILRQLIEFYSMVSDKKAEAVSNQISLHKVNIDNFKIRDYQPTDKKIRDAKRSSKLLCFLINFVQEVISLLNDDFPRCKGLLEEIISI